MTRRKSDSCTGSGAFFGLAGYSYFSGMSQLEKQRAAILQSKSIFGMRSRRFGIVTISAGLAWMGLWRALKWSLSVEFEHKVVNITKLSTLLATPQELPTHTSKMDERAGCTLPSTGVVYFSWLWMEGMYLNGTVSWRFQRVLICILVYYLDYGETWKWRHDLEETEASTKSRMGNELDKHNNISLLLISLPGLMVFVLF